MSRDNNYNTFDYISEEDVITEGKVHIKDLIKEAYDTALPLIHRLMYIESDFIYLNLVCGVPQTTIANIYNLSQLGVSKRVRGGVRKMRNLLEIPETNYEIVAKDFYNLLPPRCREIALLYYRNSVYIVVAQIVGEKSIKIRHVVQDTIRILEDFISSRGKICARLTEEPYSEYVDKQKYRNNLKDEDFLENEIVKATRYLEYFKYTVKQYNYGNYHFKAKSRDLSRESGLELEKRR